MACYQSRTTFNPKQKIYHSSKWVSLWFYKNNILSIEHISNSVRQASRHFEHVVNIYRIFILKSQERLTGYTFIKCISQKVIVLQCHVSTLACTYSSFLYIKHGSQQNVKFPEFFSGGFHEWHGVGIKTLPLCHLFLSVLACGFSVVATIIVTHCRCVGCRTSKILLNTTIYYLN